MIFFVFLTLAISKSIFVAIMKLAQKEYIKNINDSIYYVVVTSIFRAAFLFLIPPYYSYHVETSMLLYPIAFSVFYLLSYGFLLNAFKFGPASLASVIQSFGLFVPIIIGLFLWDEKINIFQIIGLILFIFILFLFKSP